MFGSTTLRSLEWVSVEGQRKVVSVTLHDGEVPLVTSRATTSMPEKKTGALGPRVVGFFSSVLARTVVRFLCRSSKPKQHMLDPHQPPPLCTWHHLSSITPLIPAPHLPPCARHEHHVPAVTPRNLEHCRHMPCDPKTDK